MKNYNKKIENLYNTINKYNQDDYLEHLGKFIILKEMAKNPQFISCKGDGLTSKKVFTETDKTTTISCRRCNKTPIYCYFI